MARRLPILLALVALALALPVARAAAPVVAAPERAPRALPTVVQDDAELLHKNEAGMRVSLAKLQELGANLVRVTAGWSILTRSPDAAKPPDFDAADPAAYEQSKWDNLDRLVRLAPEYGLGVNIDVGFWAPRWAARDPAGTDRPKVGIDPRAFARFATAVARRYSGTFVPPGPPIAPPRAPDPGILAGLGLPLPLPPPFGPEPPAPPTPAGGVPLPAVRLLTLWNEPNEPAFMGPQWRRVRGVPVPASPDTYRRMVAAAYPAIKRVAPTDVVLIGGLSPHGSYGTGTAAVPPLAFLRQLACVDVRLRPLKSGACARFHTVPGDGWSQHPYQLNNPPSYRSPLTEGDNIGVADLAKLSTMLSRLAARHRLALGVRDIYITEFGYQSNPPDRTVPWTLGDQARFLAWSEYLAQRVPRVKMWSQYELRDGPLTHYQGGPEARAGYGGFQMGLLYHDGRVKPAAAAFAAGLFVGRRADGRLLLFGRLRARPDATLITVEVARRGSRAWRRLPTSQLPGGRGVGGFTPAAGGVFQRYAREPRGRVKYQLHYLHRGVWYVSPPALAEPLVVPRATG